MENKKIRTITEKNLQEFSIWLAHEEKSPATREKYLRDVRAFAAFAGGQKIVKELVLAWKEVLVAKKYTARSINSMLSGLNSLLCFLGLEDCKVKNLKTQRQIYCPEEKELTKAEYLRLLDAAREQPQLRLVMETICGCGIRVSELQFFTTEAVGNGKIEISNKGKIRTILITGKLKKKLLDWAKKNEIREGAIFVTRNGKPLNRSNI